MNILTETGLVESHMACLSVLESLVREQKLTATEIRAILDQKRQETPGSSSQSTRTTPSIPPKSNQRTRHVALHVYYDGANYSGLAQNIGSDKDNSVEKHLFQALIKARLVHSRETCNYSRCGRTDRGVSAVGQVVALRLRSAFPNDASTEQDGSDLLADDQLPTNSFTEKTVYVYPRKRKAGSPRQARMLQEMSFDKILNNLLPKDIRVLGWCPVSPDFSARFSATSRLYRYFFCPRRMNVHAMEAAMQFMVGKHDFRNLCKMDVEKVYNFERVIYEAKVVTQSDDVAYFEILGQAFLWHQIRCIASVLFLVGQQHEQPMIVRELLDIDTCPGKPAYPLADELPLVLHDCAYRDLSVGYSVGNLWNITSEAQVEWERLVLAAARIQNLLSALDDKQVSPKELRKFCETRLQERARKTMRRQIDKSLLLPMVGEAPPFTSRTVSWRQAKKWLASNHIFADPQGARELAYVPLMKRSRGTTLEEKIEAIQKSSSKRKDRYEENVAKKRKTEEEDREFYAHKTSQGGSAH